MAYLLQRLLTEAAARQPRQAVASDGCLLIYQELDRLSNKVARALLRLGVRPATGWGSSPPSRPLRSSGYTGC